jgi:glycerate kinase
MEIARDPSSSSRLKVLVAPDAFKGTATAAEVAAGMSQGAARAGWGADPCPLSDGGEGFLDVLGVLGGDLESEVVTGPLGTPVDAVWRLAGDLAVVESARASGLVLAGGAEGNDPVAATSRGTGELILAAVARGATQVLVGVGGSATTDGGIGALSAIDEAGGLGGAEVLVACDVTVGFSEAARIFGPQKGANNEQTELLDSRLRELAEIYRRRGVDLTGVEGSGAAGGLAGGLVVAGARIVSGFDLVARLVGLDARIGAASLVLTGEGRLDATSWSGKVVGGVARRAADAGKSVIAIAGQVAEDALSDPRCPAGLRGAVDMSVLFGLDRARQDAPGCAAVASRMMLKSRAGEFRGL